MCREMGQGDRYMLLFPSWPQSQGSPEPPGRHPGSAERACPHWKAWARRPAWELVACGVNLFKLEPCGSRPQRLHTVNRCIVRCQSPCVDSTVTLLEASRWHRERCRQGCQGQEGGQRIRYLPKCHFIPLLVPFGRGGRVWRGKAHISVGPRPTSNAPLF